MHSRVPEEPVRIWQWIVSVDSEQGDTNSPGKFLESWSVNEVQTAGHVDADRLQDVEAVSSRSIEEEVCVVAVERKDCQSRRDSLQ